MDASVISALAALMGTAVGGLTSVLANWLNHRLQVRSQWLQHEKTAVRSSIAISSRRHRSATSMPCSTTTGMPIFRAWSVFMPSSAECGWYRPNQCCTAPHITQKILDTYLEPDKCFVEVRDMARMGGIDLLREFANACRDEFEDLQARQF